MLSIVAVFAVFVNIAFIVIIEAAVKLYSGDKPFGLFVDHLDEHRGTDGRAGVAPRGQRGTCGSYRLIDMPGVVRALKDGGFTGVLAVESDHHKDHQDEDALVAQSIAYIRRLLAELKA